MSFPLLARPGALLALVVLLGFIATALFAPLIAPFALNEVVGPGWQPPGGASLFGTDTIGRDVFSRLIWATRTTLAMAGAVMVLSMLSGVGAGLIAALRGGLTDQLLSRFVDLVMAVPALILILFLIAILPRGPVELVLVIALVEMTRVYRLTRLLAGEIVTREYIEAARLRGETTLWIAFREILPNCWRPLLAEAGLRLIFAVLMLSTVSFLGLGIQPPETDWGSLIRENKDGMLFGATSVLFPGMAIAILSIAIGALTDLVSERRS